jgi:prefoldin subunit 5
MAENIDEILHLDPNEVAKFDKIMKEINGFMSYHKSQETPPALDELDQFHKSWFYNNWRVRFRRLSAFTNLGARGVIAIPNTTFEEWLWWFREWSEALTDDYNEFKKMVYEALLMIQKHLEAIDKVLKDHENRITVLEKEIKEIKQDIQNIKNELTNIKQDVTNLNNKYNQLQQQMTSNNDALGKILQALKNIGVWNQTGDTIFKGEFAPGMSVAGGNINLFGGSADGGSWIRTNAGQTENDITAGI